jgi:hypothetical protein
MRVSQEEKIVAFSIVQHEDDEETAEVEAPDAEGNATEVDSGEE